MAIQRPVYRYRVDVDDRFVHVDDMWLSFAEENGAPELSEEAVLRRSLWDFIADEPTRTLYERLHNRVRDSTRPAVVAFRCDSPTLHRYMQLTITPRENGQLAYASALLKAVPRPSCRLLDTTQCRTSSFITMCSCCKRSLIESVGWLDLVDIESRFQVRSQVCIPELRYTVCPECELLLEGQGNGAA